MPSLTAAFVILIIAVALAFDFTNGMHDAANSIATIVSTRVLTPRQAVLWAAFFNFVAFLIFGTAVAHTIGTGLIDIKVVTPLVILAGLLGAIGWNLFTWYMGLPTSSSHALIGGYAGAAIVKAGSSVIIAAGWLKTIMFIFLAPVIGLVLGVILITVTTRLIHKQHPAARSTNGRGGCSSSRRPLYSLGHGGNDAQKTMGIIASLVFSAGWFKTFHIPLWIVLSAHAAIATGDAHRRLADRQDHGTEDHQAHARRRVLRRDGQRRQSIFLATYLGVPVSTTHVITGAISGVGAAKRLSAVRWGVTLQIVWAWIFTIPGAASIGAAFYYVLGRLIGIAG